MGMFAAKKEIGPDTVLQRRNDILFNEVDGEVVMLSIENGEYYGMDTIGSRIWNILNNKTSFKDLVNKLINEYDISEEKCKSDTIFFIMKLVEKDLIRL